MRTTNKNLVFVQTERQAHEAWFSLTLTKPLAAAILHKLVALLDDKNGGIVVISNNTLASMIGCHERTIRRATHDLEEGQWLQKIKLSKTVQGYAINSAVGWCGFVSDKANLAAFTATVIVPQEDIPAPVQLRRIPVLYPPGEVATPRETGGESGSQMLIPGTEPSVNLKPAAKDFTQVALPLPCPACGSVGQPDQEGTGTSRCPGCGLIY